LPRNEIETKTALRVSLFIPASEKYFSFAQLLFYLKHFFFSVPCNLRGILSCVEKLLGAAIKIELIISGLGPYDYYFLFACVWLC